MAASFRAWYDASTTLGLDDDLVALLFFVSAAAAAAAKFRIGITVCEVVIVDDDVADTIGKDMGLFDDSRDARAPLVVITAAAGEEVGRPSIRLARA